VDVYAPITLSNERITFESDAYFDPGLSILKFMQYGLIEGRVEYAGSEVDRFIITKCNDIEIIRKLQDDWPTFENVEDKLRKLGLKPKEDQPNDTIQIMQGDEVHLVTRQEWDTYFKLIGKESNAWNIPTYEQLISVTRK
jgi:hypothetical protein